jgi:hypothetical protein
MKDDRVMTVTWDQDAGQVMLEALPEGPAGGASLSPAEGIELIFDCAGGQLSRVFVAAGEAGSPPVIREQTVAMLKRLLGSRVGTAVRQAARRHGDPIPVRGDPGALASMSRLARLDAARLTSPVADSPLWPVEAARLAARAGLTARFTAEARRAASALAGATEVPSHVLAVAADAIADLVASAEPDLASKLRDALAAAKPGDAATGSRKHAKAPVLPDIAADGGEGGDLDQLHWSLDPRLFPVGLFEHALWPHAELTVRAERSRLHVEARLAAGADRRALAACRARLVDPVARRVLGVASFHDVGDSRVRAEIRKRRPSQEAWVEIVDDAGRPVFSSKLHHMRRAMRWADTALAAGRQTFGLADAGWTRLAATAWNRSAREWAVAGDRDRAYLAASHQAALYPGQDSRVEPPSGWAKELASQPPLAEEPFLAEGDGVTGRVA